MMKTMLPIIRLEFPNKVPLVYINPTLEVNSSPVFVHKKINLNISLF